MIQKSLEQLNAQPLSVPRLVVTVTVRTQLDDKVNGFSSYTGVGLVGASSARASTLVIRCLLLTCLDQLKSTDLVSL